MTPHLQRALLLLQQSRHELAESEVRQALTADPQDGRAHAVLALCLAEREQLDEATQEARQAIVLEPDLPYAHYVLSHILADRNRLDEAQTAAAEAIRLDPYDADYFSQLAAIQFRRRRWADALRAAEQGLQSDPEHVGCTNLRAMALVKLNRKGEAGRTIDAALARDPEDAVSHANMGWTLLEQGQPKKAMEHFRESLRLDPTSEWARAGIVEAMKARNIIYRLMLGYFFWMSRLDRRVQWALLIGLLFGNRILRGLVRAVPALEPFYWPIVAVYITFAVLTWTAEPLFNLLLRLDRFGRYALSREQTVASNWLGLTLLGALAAVAAAAVTGQGRFWLLAVLLGLLSLPVSGVFKCEPGWPRLLMGGTTAVLALLALGSLLPDVGSAAGGLCFLGIAASTWLGNALAMVEPRR